MNQTAKPEKVPSATRYFVAIALPDVVKDRLVELQPAAVPGMRLIGREELHLTLHFVGEIASQRDKELVRRGLEAINAKALTITIKGVGRFPPDGHAQVLWAGVQASPAFLVFHHAIGAALIDAIGFQPETRPYSPHISLARLGVPVATDAVDNYLERQRDIQIDSVFLDELGFYPSTFNDEVPLYVREATFQLKSS